MCTYIGACSVCMCLCVIETSVIMLLICGAHIEIVCLRRDEGESIMLCLSASCPLSSLCTH